ncbi:MAG: protein kinase [Streptosporangiaceae bacterium]
MLALPEGATPLGLGDPQGAGPYRFLARLGFGGMGVVYLARDPGSGEWIAIKTLRQVDLGNDDVRLRFEAEADCARQITSPRTARVLADGSREHPPYLVTEFIEGLPLPEVIEQRGPLQPDALHAVAIGMADALAAIHAAGFIHRDVKPSNVLLDESGPRLIDFGIARPLDAAGGLTQTGLLMGSPGWVAPERISGGQAVTASDIFGWGQLVAYAGTGRHPFGPGDPLALTERTMTLAPDLTGLTEPLRSLAHTALSKDPALRPTASALLASLLVPRGEPTAEMAVATLWESSAHAGLVTAPVRPAPPRSRSWIRTAPFLWMGAGAVVAAAALVAFQPWSGEGPGQRVEVTVPTTVTRTAAPQGTTSRSNRPSQIPATGGSPTVRPSSGSPKPTVTAPSQPTTAPSPSTSTAEKSASSTPQAQLPESEAAEPGDG